MSFYAFLRTLALDLLDRYRRWFLMTYNVALMGSVLAFAGMAWMFKISPFPRDHRPQNLAEPLFSIFSTVYSGYCYTDLSRVILFFFVALFAMVIGRLEDRPPEGKTLSLGTANRFYNNEYFWTLVGMGAVTALADMFLYQAKNFALSEVSGNEGLYRFVSHAFIIIRLFLPPMILTACLKHSLFVEGRRWSARAWLFLLVGLFLVEIIAYNTYIQVNEFVFSLPLAFFPDRSFSNANLLLGSFLSIPLIACFFVGFASVMITSSSFVARYGRLPRVQHEATPEDLFTEPPDS